MFSRSVVKHQLINSWNISAIVLSNSNEQDMIWLHLLTFLLDLFLYLFHNIPPFVTFIIWTPLNKYIANRDFEYSKYSIE